MINGWSEIVYLQEGYLMVLVSLALAQTPKLKIQTAQTLCYTPQSSLPLANIM